MPIRLPKAGIRVVGEARAIRFENQQVIVDGANDGVQLGIGLTRRNSAGRKNNQRQQTENDGQ